MFNLDKLGGTSANRASSFAFGLHKFSNVCTCADGTDKTELRISRIKRISLTSRQLWRNSIIGIATVRGFQFCEIRNN